MKLADRSHSLLLTSCIAPKPDVARLLRRADPALRLQDYADSLRFWLRLGDPRVGALVFADNSGHPLDSLREIAAREAPESLAVEFHSLDYPAPSPLLSYGHPEMLLVNEVLERSPALARLPFFAKVTGRYRFPDFSRLLDRLPADYQVAVDSTGAPFWPFSPSRKANPISHFALGFFRREFYLEHLRDIPGRMRPAPPWNRMQFVEPMIYDTLLPLRHKPGVIMRWPRNCEPLGIGANGHDYRDRRRRTVALVRAVFRKITPRWWI